MTLNTEEGESLEAVSGDRPEAPLPSMPAPPTSPRRSRAAVWSLVLWLAAVGAIAVAAAGTSQETPDEVPAWRGVVAVIAFVAWIAAFVAAIVALVAIRRSKGALKGRGVAVTSLVVTGLLTALGVVGTIASKSGGVVLRDDFESAHVWAEDDDPFVTQRYVDGAYEVLLKKPGPQYSRHFFDRPSTSRLRFSADVTVVDDQNGSVFVGVACWAGPSTGYVAAIDQSGHFAILRQFADRPGEVLEQGPGAPRLVPGQTLRLSIECIGGGPDSTTIVARAGGQQVGRAVDGEGFDGFGAVALWYGTEKAGAVVRWDNALAEAA